MCLSRAHFLPMLCKNVSNNKPREQMLSILSLTFSFFNNNQVAKMNFSKFAGDISLLYTCLRVCLKLNQCSPLSLQLGEESGRLWALPSQTGGMHVCRPDSHHGAHPRIREESKNLLFSFFGAHNCIMNIQICSHIIKCCQTFLPKLNKVISSAWNLSALLFTACKVDIKWIFFSLSLLQCTMGLTPSWRIYAVQL